MFWDTSALVKAYSQEVGTPSVLGAFNASRGKGFVTEYVGLELLSVLGKQLRTNQLSRGQYRSAVAEFYRDFPSLFHVLEVEENVRAQAYSYAEVYRRVGVGALDVLHLASAKQVQKLSGSRPVVFATADDRLKGVAHAEGMLTFHPERDPLANLLSHLR